MCFHLCCYMPLVALKAAIGFMILLPLTLISQLCLFLFYLPGNICHAYSVLCETPRLYWDAKILVAPAIAVLWIGPFLFTILDSIYQAFDLGFCRTCDEMFQVPHPDPCEPTMCDRWYQRMLDFNFYLRTQFKQNLDIHKAEFADGRPPLSLILFLGECCGSCGACLWNVFMFGMLLLFGLLAMVTDIVVYLLIYLINLPRMIAFGWCRSCNGFKDTWNWYQEQLAKSNTPVGSCRACWADCYMSATCCSYGVYFVFYPLIIIFGIVLVPFQAIYASLSTTGDAWMMEDLCASLEGLWEARKVNATIFWNVCAAMGSREVDDNARVNVVIDRDYRSRKQGRMSNQQQQPNFNTAPVNPPRPAPAPSAPPASQNIYAAPVPPPQQNFNTGTGFAPKVAAPPQQTYPPQQAAAPQQQSQQQQSAASTAATTGKNFLMAATNAGVGLASTGWSMWKESQRKKKEEKRRQAQPSRAAAMRGAYGYYNHRQPNQYPPPQENQQEPRIAFGGPVRRNV